MIKLHHLLAIVMASLALPCCKSLQTVNEIPAAIYTVSSKRNIIIDSSSKEFMASKPLKLDVEETNGVLVIKLISEQPMPATTKISRPQNLYIYRHTFDMDILTIPIKIRPSVKNFPEQLNADFSTAIYFGYRRDSYHLQSAVVEGSKASKSGVGYGFGAFIGIGAVTMNPFVTQQQIDYEYEGLVWNVGFAGIYDAKKFNLGIAIGVDHLTDKNGKNWIYQNRPWFGLLFGINLN